MCGLKASVPEHIEYPRIDPVPEGIHKPFWSVMIPTYNCAQYLERTLKSVLEQDPGPEEMQIEVVDDYSKDDVEAVVQKVGKGRVSFYRQPKNVGATANFNTCLNRSTGSWIHVLHGDDFVLLGFYNAVQDAISRCGKEVDACFIRSAIVDENDKLLGYFSVLPCKEPFLLDGNLDIWWERGWTPPVGIVIRRSFLERTGGYNPKYFHVADTELAVRVAYLGNVAVVNTPLAHYRSYSGSDTGQLIKSGANKQDLLVYLDDLLAKGWIDEPKLRAMRSKVFRDWVNQAIELRSRGFSEAFKANLIAMQRELRPGERLPSIPNSLAVQVKRLLKRLIPPPLRPLAKSVQMATPQKFFTEMRSLIHRYGCR